MFSCSKPLETRPNFSNLVTPIAMTELRHEDKIFGILNSILKKHERWRRLCEHSFWRHSLRARRRGSDHFDAVYPDEPPRTNSMVLDFHGDDFAAYRPKIPANFEGFVVVAAGHPPV